VALNRALMIAALAAMAVIVFANVALRYLTDESIVWSEEVARYLMIWLTFLGIGPVLRVGGHIAIDTLPAALPQGAARVLRTLLLLMVGGFCLAGAWYGYALVQRTIPQTTPVTDVSFALVSAAVPTGFLLAVWHLVAVARGYVESAAFEVSADMNPGEAGSI
jgi:TRAP-type C4-dicarboxylate transport system permease small subunit